VGSGSPFIHRLPSGLINGEAGGPFSKYFLRRFSTFFFSETPDKSSFLTKDLLLSVLLALPPKEKRAALYE